MIASRPALAVIAAVLVAGCSTSRVEPIKGDFQAWTEAEAAQKNQALTPLRPKSFGKSEPPAGSVSETFVDRAKWAMHGSYLAKIITSVNKRWDQILTDSRKYPPSGTAVEVTFTISSDGKVVSFLDVKSTTDETGKSACLSAISQAGPFERWTPQMISRLGNVQQLTFTFYYQ